LIISLLSNWTSSSRLWYSKLYICTHFRVFLDTFHANWSSFLVTELTFTKLHSSTNCSRRNYAVLQACRKRYVFSSDRNWQQLLFVQQRSMVLCRWLF